MLTVFALNCIFLLCHYHTRFYHQLTFLLEVATLLEIGLLRGLFRFEIADIFSLIFCYHEWLRTELDLGSNLLVCHRENKLNTPVGVLYKKCAT